FLMAPRHHSAMRHVAGPRGELGIRTIFNVLGPLSNPAGVKRQFTGVFDREWIEPMAGTLGKLGSEAAWGGHGSDGLDELTTTGPSFVAELKDGKVTTFEVSPSDAGIAEAKPEDLSGGNAEDNAAGMRAVLGGVSGALRDVTIFNAAAALLVAGKAADLRQGADMAADSIDSGRAKAALEALVAITNEETA
ncbi:MAG: anthranilate phosphoribosyltransferase, partial [Rhodospirillales bacterium]|nr:anthranilate phosphoribosyltransferase [Rhodospirillales bacterium]